MYLVTGAAGFIGFHLSLFLLKKQKSVVGIDNINNYYNKKIKFDRLKILKKYPNFKFFKIDLKNKKTLSKKISKYKNKIDIIIHLAGQAGVRYSINNPITYIENNIISYINLLEFFKDESKPKLIIYASSSSIYGEKGSKESNSSKIQNNPISIYSASKLTMELISKVYNHLYKINFIGIRFFSVYGPWGRPDMFYLKFLERIKLKKTIYIYNYGKHYRSFTYIDDVVLNLFKIINKFGKKNINICDVFNIGNPISIHLKSLINIIEKKIGIKAKKKFVKKQPGDLTLTKSLVEREKRIFGHKTTTKLNYGIDELIKWYNNYYN
tara:strand:- start:205 stop:1176 length:972 start_codon:yes stop_codon:yes gene_type:complete